MSSKPEKWLQALANDAESHCSLGFVERFRRALRYFRTGRNKATQKALRDFATWKEQQGRTPAIATAIDTQPAAGNTTPGPLAASDALSSTRFIIVDYRGGEHLRRTLDSLPLEALHSYAVVSPYVDDFTGDRYFDLFPALDRVVRETTDATSLVLLESGAVLTSDPEPLRDNTDVHFLRWQSHDGKLQPSPLDSQSLLREPLAPMVFPALQLRPGTDIDFSSCWHYAGWDLLLQFIETAPERISFPETVSVNFVHHDYQLSKLDRKQLATSDSKILQRLPDAAGEWSVTRHDLIGRIVQRHPDYFQDNAAYLAAIAAATRGC